MNKLRILAFSLIWIALSTLLANAQNFPLTVSVNISPPYTNRWQDYTGNGNRIQVRIQNNSGLPYSVYLAGYFLRIPTKDIGVQALPTPIPTGRLSIQAGVGVSSFYTGVQLAQFFTSSGSTVQAVGLTDEELSRGIMPEGEYQLCLVAYDSQGQPLSDPLQGCSNPISVSWLFPPRPTLPACGTVVSSRNPQLINFTWTPPTGRSIGGQMRYRFILVQVPEGMDPNYALNNVTYPVLDTTGLIATTFNYTNANPPLQAGTTYAWRVQAQDISGTYGLQNEGLSEPCSFIYADGFTSRWVYPAQGDWIPFTSFPIVSEFGPYSERYKRFESSISVSGLGFTGRSYQRVLQWQDGPLRSQREAGIAVQNTQQASQIAIFPTDDSYQDIPMYTRGGRYRFTANTAIGFTINAVDRSRSSSFSGSFNVGMSQSRLISPADRDTLAPGNLRFSFHTADRPSNLLPPFMIEQIQRGDAIPRSFDGQILEKWILEVSRQENFSTIDAQTSGTLGNGVRLLAVQDPEQLANSLYTDLNRELRIDSSGQYFWRVKWVNNPQSNTDTSAYQYSVVRRFFIKNGTLSRPDTARENPTPGSCIASCDAAPITDRSPSSALSVGQTVQIGRFQMLISAIEWQENLASGTGSIAIPFMNIRVAVRFSGARFNAQNQLIEGQAQTEYDNLAPIQLGQSGRFLSQLSGLSDAQVNGLATFVSQTNRLVSQFTGNLPVKMPIGFDNTIDNQRYVIGIVGMQFTRERAVLNAMIRLDIEGTQGWLSLGASDLCFHPRGLAGTGRGMLYNPTDKVIPMGNTRLIFKRTVFADDQFSSITDSGTYARWDCEGFKALQVKGEIIFGTDIALKENPDGSIAADSVVKGQFRATLRRGKNFVLHYTMDRFQSTFARGYGFEVRDAILDLSDLETPEELLFPTGYFSQERSLWRGFYLGALRMYLPADFRHNQGRRVSFDVSGIIIDRNGLTIDAKIRNLFSPSECNMDGWGFGIDSLNFKMVRNSFVEAGMQGRLRMPISPSDLTYNANISSDGHGAMNYTFGIGSTDTIQVPLWFAKMKLNPGTTFGIQYSSHRPPRADDPSGSGGFSLQARLHGSISITGFRDPVGPFDFPAVSFQDLILQSREPYIGCPGGTPINSCVRFPIFGQASPQKNLGGFPVNLDSVFLDLNQTVHLLEWDKSPGPRVGLGAKISIITETTNKNTTTASGGTQGSNFQCTTVIRFRGKMNMAGGMAWVPSGLVVDSVVIKGRSPAVDIDGSLAFYSGDETFGNGFRGQADATIRPGFNLKAFVQFGTKENTDYWFVDGMFSSPAGIPLGPTGIALYGFGGGAYRNMRLQGDLPSVAILSGPPSQMNRSGIRYVPDLVNSTVGIRASVGLGAIKKEVFYGEATLDVAVSPTAGLQSISLQGRCWFLKNDAGTNNALRGDLAFTYLVPSQSFDGNINVYVNVLGGKLKGSGPNDLAGNMHLHFDPNTWFIKLGDPSTQRVGLDLNLTNSIRPHFSAYLMTGKQLPPIPEPGTPMLAELFRQIPSQSRMMQTPGDGFMLGVAAWMNTGNQTVADFLRYRFAVEFGFDMELKNLSSVQCANPGNNGSFTPGINGWYCQGQVYAGVSGAVALKVPVLTDQFINLVDFGAWFLMRAGLVNPSWLDGEIRASLNVLNGLVRIENARLPFSLGESCRVVAESPMASVALISDLSPAHDPAGRNIVDVTTNPELMLNFPIGRAFSLETVDANMNPQLEWFRVQIESFRLTKAGVGHPAQILLDANVWEHATLALGRAMDANSIYTVQVSAIAQKGSSQYGPWVNALRKDNSTISEQRANTFKTGQLPTRLRNDQVFHSYPIRNQRYFLQSECREGYLALSQESATVVLRPDERPGASTRFFLRFIPIDGSQQPVEVNFSQNNSFLSPAPPNPPIPQPSNYVQPVMPRISIPLLSYTIPNLQNNKVYAVQLIRKVSLNSSTPTSSYASIRESLSPALQAYITRKVLGPLAAGNGETIVYQYFFKTSQFNRLSEKVGAMTVTSARRTPVFIYHDVVNINMSHIEPFEEFDALTTQFTNSLGLSFTYQPLVRVRTDMAADWSREFLLPNIYDFASRLVSQVRTYRTRSIEQIFTRSSNGDPGIPPTKAVYFSFGNTTLSGALRPNECTSYSPMVNRLLAESSAFQINPILGQYTMITPLTSGMGYNQSTVFSYDMPTWAQMDWAALKSVCQSITAIYGQPETSEFIPQDLKAKFRRVLNNQYEYMRAGNYSLLFRYVPPLGPCYDPDYPTGSPNSSAPSSFTKTVTVQ